MRCVFQLRLRSSDYMLVHANQVRKVNEVCITSDVTADSVGMLECESQLGLYLNLANIGGLDGYVEFCIHSLFSR